MKENDKKAILKLLETAEKEGFYGEITFRFKAGEIYGVFKGQSLKMENLTE